MRIPACPLLLFFAVCGTARADIVEFRQGQNLTGTGTPYSGAQDTFLNANSTPSAASSGSSGYIISIPNSHHILMRFDDIISPSGATQGLIPQKTYVEPDGTLVETTIESATFSMYRDGSVARDPDIVNLHRILLDWSEDTSGTTRTNTANFLPGEAKGGVTLNDIEAEMTAFSQSDGVTVGGDYWTADVTDFVQGVHDGLFPNYGFVLGGPEDGRHFLSSHGTLAFRPLLTVEFSQQFTPPLMPEPGSLVLWGIFGVAVALAAFRRQRRRQVN